MKKITLSAAILALAMMGCSDTGVDNSVASTSEVNDSSVLPYFVFAKNGARLDENGVEKKMERSTLVLGENETFDNLKKKYLEKLKSDNNYYWELERPADYYCDDVLLAINSDYEVVVSSSGDSLLTDYSLYKGCKALSDYPVIQNGNEKKQNALNKLVVNEHEFKAGVLIQDGIYAMLGKSSLNGAGNTYYGVAETIMYKHGKPTRADIYAVAMACVKGSTCGWNEFGVFSCDVYHTFQIPYVVPVNGTSNLRASYQCDPMGNDMYDIGTVAIHSAIVNWGKKDEIKFMVATKSDNLNYEWAAAISQVYIHDIYANQ